MKVGFVGLGNMGLGMARNLIKAGHTLTVYNRTKSRAEELRQLDARVAGTPGDAASDAEVVVTMLADDNAVEETGEFFPPRRQDSKRTASVQVKPC